MEVARDMVGTLMYLLLGLLVIVGALFALAFVAQTLGDVVNFVLGLPPTDYSGCKDPADCLGGYR